MRFEREMEPGIIRHTLQRFVISILLFTMVLSGCITKPSLYCLSPEYQNRRIHHATLLVLPLSEDIIDSEVQEELLKGRKVVRHFYNLQEHQYFLNYMGPVLDEVSTLRVIGIDPSYRPQDIEFEYRELSTNEKRSQSMFVPVSGRFVYFDQVPEFVLLLEDLYFDKNRSSGSKSASYSSNTGQVFMKAGLKYLIWDNKKSSVVGYGRFKNSHTYLCPPTKQSYIEIFEAYAESIIVNSPFLQKEK